MKSEPPGVPHAPLPEHVLAILRCPVTGAKLVPHVATDGTHWLVTTDGSRRYPVIEGLPVLTPEALELLTPR